MMGMGFDIGMDFYRKRKNQTIKKIIILEFVLLILCALGAFSDVIDKFFLSLPYQDELNKMVSSFYGLNMAVLIFLGLYLFYMLIFFASHLVSYTCDSVNSDVLSGICNVKTIKFICSKKSIEKYESIDSDIVRTEYIVSSVDKCGFFINRSKFSQVYYYKPLGVFFFSDLHTDVFGSDRTVYSYRDRFKKIEGVSDVDKEFAKSMAQC